MPETGTDSFTGGFENDTVDVSAAAVGGDTLTGGSGTNTLALTSAGTVSLGGVSNFGTIDLFAGNNTVLVSAAVVSGDVLIRRQRHKHPDPDEPPAASISAGSASSPRSTLRPATAR